MGNVCKKQSIPSPNCLQQCTPVEIMVLKKESSHSHTRSFHLINDPNIQKALNLKKPFQQEFQKLKETLKSKDYPNGSRFIGQINEEDKPNGLGKLFEKDGSIIIGHSKQGKLQGRSFYANINGIILEGQVQNGAINCSQGNFQSPKCKYKGGFKDNFLSGEGVYVTQDSKFQGIFLQGKKKSGKFSWPDGQYIYSYEGNFDQNEKFSGNGRLNEPFGVYEGQFNNGEKHGKGKYTFTSKLIYEGNYKLGKRQGQGKLINKDGTLSYEGQFKNGLPNGKGKSYRYGSISHQGMFLDGIPEQLL